MMIDNDRQRKAYYIVEHASDDAYDTSKFTKWIDERKSKPIVFVELLCFVCHLCRGQNRHDALRLAGAGRR